MEIIKSPEDTSRLLKGRIKIFLAGSIEMGVAACWQETVATDIENVLKQSNSTLSPDDFILLNPRREDWDNSWKAVINDPYFNQQVKWELSSLRLADWIIMYFDPSTRSPISLLELGLFANSKKLVVICPDGFWRKGNVDIVCETYNITQCDTLVDACAYIVQPELAKR